MPEGLGAAPALNAWSGLVRRMTRHDEGVVSPTKTGRDPSVGPYVIMVMTRPALNGIARKVPVRRVSFSGSHLFEIFESRSPSGRPVHLAGPFFGSPHAVAGLEKLIALGARRILALGWCGALDPGLSIGDVIIPSRAFSEEGTSRLYTGSESDDFRSPDADLTALVRKALDGKGIATAEGPIWTTDGLYRETPAKIKAYRSMGALAVEMEMSALMGVAKFRSVALAALLVVSDILRPTGWKPGFSDRRLVASCEEVGTFLVDFAGEIAGTNSRRASLDG